MKKLFIVLFVTILCLMPNAILALTANNLRVRTDTIGDYNITSMTENQLNAAKSFICVAKYGRWGEFKYLGDTPPVLVKESQTKIENIMQWLETITDVHTISICYGTIDDEIILYLAPENRKNLELHEKIVNGLIRCELRQSGNAF